MQKITLQEITPEISNSIKISLATARRSLQALGKAPQGFHLGAQIANSVLGFMRGLTIREIEIEADPEDVLSQDEQLEIASHRLAKIIDLDLTSLELSDEEIQVAVEESAFLAKYITQICAPPARFTEQESEVIKNDLRQVRQYLADTREQITRGERMFDRGAELSTVMNFFVRRFGIEAVRSQPWASQARHLMDAILNLTMLIEFDLTSCPPERYLVEMALDLSSFYVEEVRKICLDPEPVKNKLISSDVADSIKRSLSQVRENLKQIQERISDRSIEFNRGEEISKIVFEMVFGIGLPAVKHIAAPNVDHLADAIYNLTTVIDSDLTLLPEKESLSNQLALVCEFLVGLLLDSDDPRGELA